MKLLNIAIINVILYLVFIFLANSGQSDFALMLSLVLLLGAFIIILIKNKEKYISGKVMLLWLLFTIIELFISPVLFPNIYTGGGFISLAGIEVVAWGIFNVIFIIVLLISNGIKKAITKNKK